MNIKRESEMKNVASEIQILDQEIGTFTCPSCGSYAYHFNGIFTNDTFKNQKILIAVKCESCGARFGSMQSFGNGTDILESVLIRYIGNNWERLL